MAWMTAAGATFALASTSAAPATYDEAGYDALAFTNVGEITNIGEFGGEYALVTHQPLATRGVGKRKGSFNNGTLNPNLAWDPGDPGQELLDTAYQSDDPWPMRVTLQDGSVFYMMGLVMSYRPIVNGVDEVVGGTPTIEVDSTPMVRVAAP